jgi:FkbM family methyltransferase
LNPLTKARRLAGAVKRQMWPSRELSAWRKATRASAKVPRFTPGRIQLGDYDLEYTDLLTLCPQWYDVFVRKSLDFSLEGQAPRILDCGANVGLASLYFKTRYPGARITAFEADPAIAEVLLRNLERNGCGDVEVTRAAVWIEDGKVDFRCEGADSGTIDALAGDLRGETRTVPSVRLRRVLAAGKIDVVKLDIEGGEESVLCDCIEALRHVRVLLLDLHEFDPTHRRISSVLDVLRQAGFVWSFDNLCPLPWRQPTASRTSPFPGLPLCWSMLIRAWRPPGSST